MLNWPDGSGITIAGPGAQPLPYIRGLKLGSDRVRRIRRTDVKRLAVPDKASA